MKTDKKLTPFSIAIRNLKAQKVRTGFMFFFVTLMSATFFFSNLLMNNLALGIQNTTDRMGADVIVVPQEGTEDIRESLFAGRPCSVFFDKSWQQNILELEGIKKSSPQLFIATLAASCCDTAVQLTAFDPHTDFVIQPWLKDNNTLSLSIGEIVIGHSIVAQIGDTLKFYDTDFTVVGTLEETGMGYDNSVFMTFDTAYQLKESSVANAALPMEKIENNISILLIDIDEDITAEELVILKIKIQNAGDEGQKMRAFTVDELISGIAQQVQKLSGYGTILTTILVVAVALSLISIFFITINERKYEFGILYTLGATKKFITNIILWEAMLLSFAGGVVGIVFSWYGIILFRELISINLDIPYLNIGFVQGGPVAVHCMAIALFTGIIAAIISAYKISQGEAYRLIRESE